MTIAEAYDRISYRGDSLQPADGEHDLRVVVAQVVRRLPASVRWWVLEETRHVFIGGHGQLGEFFEVFLPIYPAESKEGAVSLRVVFLSETPMRLPKSEALWTIAHEIAHGRLNHRTGGGYECEVAADKPVRRWGFKQPRHRACERQRYKLPS